MFEQVEAFYRPASVRQAVRLLQGCKGQARVVAGGTDVVVEADRAVRFLIDITRAGLSYIRGKDGACVIGATATMAGLEESAVIRGLAGGLIARAAATCGSVQVRNLATLGGNMANGSPAADLATVLLALDAEVVVAGPAGRKKLPVAEYLARGAAGGLGKSLLIEAIVPRPPRGKRRGWSFQKLGRTALDISLVNVAAGLQLDAAGRVKWLRIALGAVAPTAIRARAAEEKLTGRKLDRALLAEACETVMGEVDPIDDPRASAAYRRRMSGLLAGRAVEECAAQAGCAL
jgi:carbon-monoxide dehydrogenase medium subunit